MPPTLRPSARVVLVDDQDRLLLVRIVDDGAIVIPDGPPAPTTYWVTPGGGAEPGETLEQTARREVFEETGITDFVLGSHLWERRVDFVLRGEEITAVEHYFSGAVDTAALTFEHLDDLEDGVLVEHRWWTLADLTDADREETIFPPSIGELARRAIDERR